VVERTLKELVELLKEEKKSLLSFTLENPESFTKLQERKKELLLKLSQLDREDFKEHLELVEEVKSLHEEVKALLLNNISFLEELFKELSNNETYAKRSSPSFFKGKA